MSFWSQRKDWSSLRRLSHAATCTRLGKIGTFLWELDCEESMDFARSDQSLLSPANGHILEQWDCKPITGLATTQDRINFTYVQSSVCKCHVILSLVEQTYKLDAVLDYFCRCQFPLKRVFHFQEYNGNPHLSLRGDPEWKTCTVCWRLEGLGANDLVNLSSPGYTLLHS